MLLLFLAACGEPTESKDPTQQTTPVVEGDIELSPATLDFGTLTEPGSAPLTVVNGGSGGLTVLGVTATSSDLSFELPSNIAPGETGEIVVTWAPLTAAPLSDTLEIEILSTSQGKLDLTVPVSGVASWGSLSLTLDPADFGTVNVGCTGDATLSVSNIGTADLVIDDISMLDGSAYALASTDGSELPAFPWTIVAGGTQILGLGFTPPDDGEFEDILQVSSSDPVLPVEPVDVTGLGNIDGENTVTYTVGDRDATTVIFAVNEVVTYNPFNSRFVDALPTFFETLLASGVDFRVAFTLQTSGEITGSIPYIDETFSAEDAVDAMEEMLDEPGMGDNDYLLDTFSKSIPLNSDWLLDESDEWADSKLSLIAINSDVEQSTGNATLYVSEFQEYKDDPSDIIVNAISGPYPRGCTEAEPAELLYSAAELTGGALYSICETDWTTHMVSLAEAALSDQTDFVLSGEPAASSIEVSVNGIAVTTGWSYDAETNEVVFDADSYPDAGSEVSIHYLMATTCE